MPAVQQETVLKSVSARMKSKKKAVQSKSVDVNGQKPGGQKPTALANKIREKLLSERELNTLQCRNLFRRQQVLQMMRIRGLSPRGISDWLLKHDYKNYVNQSTIYRWLKLERVSERALAGRRQWSGRAIIVEDAVILFCIWKKSINSKIKYPALHKELVELKEELGIGKVPSVYTIRRHMKRIPESLRSGLNSSARAYFEKHGQIVRNVGTIPNEYCQIDFCVLNIWVWDNEAGKMIQPHIILFVDRDFAVVYGWLGTKAVPNSDDLILCAKIAILPDPRTGCAHGTWGHVQSDNAKVFKSNDFIRGMEKLNIKVFYSHPYCPSENGAVEAAIRTIKIQFADLFDDYARRRSIGGNSEFTLTWEAFLDLFQGFIYYYNNKRKHSKFGLTPYHAWNSAPHRTERIAPDRQRVHEALVITREWPVGQDGIELARNRFYTGPCLHHFTGKHLTVAHPPEGPGSSVRVYHKERFIGNIVCLADAPKVAIALKETFAEGRRSIRKFTEIAREGFGRIAETQRRNLEKRHVEAVKRPLKKQPPKPRIVVPSVTKGGI
jgi:hypothetical protein